MWENMPEGLEERLREEGRRKLAECEVMEVPPKHKYVKIQGKDKRETRDLLREFYERNPQFKGREVSHGKRRMEFMIFKVVRTTRATNVKEVKRPGMGN